MIKYKPITAQQIEPQEAEQATVLEVNNAIDVTVPYFNTIEKGDPENKVYPIITRGNFWRKAIDLEKGIEKEKFAFNYPEFEEFVGAAGFYQMLIKYKDKADDYEFIQQHGQIVKPANILKIKRSVLDWTRTFKATDIRGDLMRGASRYFSKDFLTCLPVKEIKFKKDTATCCTIFFKNCFVEIKLDDTGNATIQPCIYNKLDGHVWSSQIIDREFTWNDDFMKGDFARFLMLAINKPKAEHYKVEYDAENKEISREFLEPVYNASYFFPGQKLQNENGELTEPMSKLLSVMSGMGYMMHGHKSMSFAKLFGVFDAKYSREGDSMGRSGKSLIFKAIEQLVPTFMKDGKDVNFAKEKETFNGVDRSTRVIVFNDVKPNFDFTNLFHKITEGIEIKRLYQDPVSLKYDESPKFGLTGNFALRGADDSSLDRQFIVELEDFFNAHHKPVHFFKRDFWSQEWDQAEWDKFYSFMIRCIAVWLENNFFPFPALNYHYKQLAQTVRPEFIDFMQATDDGEIMIKEGSRYPIKEMYENYIKANPDFDKLTQHTFTKNLKMYCKHFNLLINPHLKDGRDRNKGADYVTIWSAERWEQEQRNKKA